MDYDYVGFMMKQIYGRKGNGVQQVARSVINTDVVCTSETIAEADNAPAEKDRSEVKPAKPNKAEKKTPNKPPENDTAYQQEFVAPMSNKPSFGDLVMYLISHTAVVCIGESLYLYQCLAGYYKALSLSDDTFTRYVFQLCPFWFKRELHMNMMGKIYHDMIGVIQNYQQHRCFDENDVELTKRHYILTSDSVYDIKKGSVMQGFSEEMPFVRRGLGIRLVPFWQKKTPHYDHFDVFLEAISDGSEQVKSVFKGFLGCLFANSEYNPKKIVILHGDKATIRAIVKFLEYCLNKENISRIPIDKLADRYALQDIERKSVYISSHINSQKLIQKMRTIIQMFTDEYIYTENKTEECTILNDKCFVFCTDGALDINTLIDSVDSLDGVLLIPISKAVTTKEDIDHTLNKLAITSGYMFCEAMKAREALEDNEWEFEPSPEIEAVFTSVETVQAERKADELQAVIDFLDKCCDFGRDKKVKKNDIVSCVKDYCEQNGRTEFENDALVEGIRIKVCEVLGITPETFNKTYERGYGKNIMVEGKQGRAFEGICLKR